MKPNRWLPFGLVLMMAVGLAMLPTAGAASGLDPGSEQDPLVAKSYVDSLISLQVLELDQGAVVRGEAGTEMVLRGGQAVAVTTPQGGLADLTGGRDIQNGETVPANHLLLIPRSDGRGLLALTD
ncbi:MAG TPA: hypothetical protein VJ036_02150, partial [bacterium]|nr:hypothetical protein [bacterium]